MHIYQDKSKIYMKLAEVDGREDLQGWGSRQCYKGSRRAGRQRSRERGPRRPKRARRPRSGSGWATLFRANKLATRSSSYFLFLFFLLIDRCSRTDVGRHCLQCQGLNNLTNSVHIWTLYSSAFILVFKIPTLIYQIFN